MSPMSFVTVLAPEPTRWDRLRAQAHEDWGWLATPDERVLWAILAAALILAAWGAWAGFRRPPQAEPGE